MQDVSRHLERTPAYIENVRVIDCGFEIECDAEPRAVLGQIALASQTVGRAVFRESAQVRWIRP